MRTLMTVALAMAVLASPVSAALPPAAEADLRCFAILSATVRNMPEGDERLQLAGGVMFFVGRLDVAVPDLDIKAEFDRLVPTLTNEQAARDSERCGAILIEKGRKLMRLAGEPAPAQ